MKAEKSEIQERQENLLCSRRNNLLLSLAFQRHCVDKQAHHSVGDLLGKSIPLFL